MEFGIGIPTSGESWKVAQRAEELGFTHAWFYDTQMLVGDPFVAMGAAALKTSRIRLGTGVLVPTNRIPAVTASAFATLNAMAPGRIDFGVGTGFSARRAMGLGAMKLADMCGRPLERKGFLLDPALGRSAFMCPASHEGILVKLFHHASPRVGVLWSGCPRRSSRQRRISLRTSHPAGQRPHHGPAFGTGELQESGTTL